MLSKFAFTFPLPPTHSFAGAFANAHEAFSALAQAWRNTVLLQDQELRSAFDTAFEQRRTCLSSSEVSILCLL